MFAALQGLNNRALQDRTPSSVANQTASGQGHLLRAAAGTTTAAQQTWDQHDQHQQQQRQQRLLLDETWPPGTILVGAHGDNESYQGPLGGTVTVPKRHSPLWRAAYYGNVPTQWWLDKSSNSMGTASVRTTTVVNHNNPSSCSSSSSPSRCTISSWSELVAQSAYIQQAFRQAGPTAPHFRWHRGVLVFGREPRLGSSRTLSPCPRPVINRLARSNMRGRVSALEQLVLGLPPSVTAAHVAYMHSRRPACSLQVQQPTQQQQRSYSRHRRYRLRSHHWVAAADVRARWRGWRAVSWRPSSSTTTTTTSSSSPGAMPLVLQNDIVLRISGPDMEMQAQQYAIIAGTASRCTAECDEQGRVIVPLPEGCIGAGCRRSSSGACTRSNRNSGQLQQQSDLSSGADPVQGGNRRVSSCVAVVDANPHATAGRTRHRSFGRRAAAGAPGDPDVAAASTPAAVAQQLGASHRTTSSCTAALDGVEHHLDAQHAPESRACYNPDATGPNMRQLEEFLRSAGLPFFATAVVQEVVDGDAVEQPHSDSDWDSDADDDVYDDSDLDSDLDDEDDGTDMGVLEVELPVEVQAAIAAPHVFRNSRDIIYGFWSKCPLG